MTTENEYNPDFVTSPAETLREIIDSGNIFHNSDIVRNVLDGEPITAESAKVLERITKVPAHFWLNRQARYEASIVDRGVR